MCVAMEERIEIKKNSLLAFEPVEVKVVEISGQARICNISQDSDADALTNVTKVYNF